MIDKLVLEKRSWLMYGFLQKCLLYLLLVVVFYRPGFDITDTLSIHFLFFPVYFIVASVFYPVFINKKDWATPESILFLFISISVLIPGFYYIFDPGRLQFKEPYLFDASHSDYFLAFAGILLCMIAIYFSSILKVKHISPKQRQKKYSRIQRSTMLLYYLLFFVLSMYAIYSLYAGIDGYVRKFWLSGMRQAPELQNARLLFLGKLGIPLSQILFLYFVNYPNFKPQKLNLYKRTALLFLFIAGGISIYNLGGRTIIVQYFLSWLLLYHICIKKIKWRSLIKYAIPVFIVLILITKIRESYVVFLNSGKAPYEQIFSWTLDKKSEEKSPFTKIDKVGATVIPFTYAKGLDDKLLGETYLADFQKAVYAFPKLVNIRLEVTCKSITNYTGKWISDHYDNTSIPSSIIGEGYANFGFTGVVINSIVLSFMLLFFKIKKKAFANSPSPEYAVLWIMGVTFLLPQAFYGGIGSTFSLLLFYFLPIFILSQFSMLVRILMK